MLDHENKKEIDSITKQCLEQFNFVQEKHGVSVSKIHIQAEKCLVKDYLAYMNFSSFLCGVVECETHLSNK